MHHEMVDRQPKIYGPLVGILLANLFSKSVLAKYAPFGAPQLLGYDPSPWLAYNKPASQSQESYNNPKDSYWYPVKNPYNYGTPQTTEAPHFHHHHHHIPNQPSQQQIVNINENAPDVTLEDAYQDLDGNNPTIATNIENPHEFQEPIAAESNVQRQRVPPPKRRKITTLKPKKSVKRGTPSRYTKRNKYRRPSHTTTPEYYYDSFEDYITTNRYKSKRKTKPRRPVDDYYEDEDEEDYDYDSSYEYTTKPIKRRRKPTQKRNKNKKRQEITAVDNYSDEDYDYDRTETVQLRPRQATTMTPTTAGTTQTIITNGTTVPMSNHTTNATGYGYGPSNGNEGISITYGPPHGAYGPPRPSYGPPQPSYGPPLNGQYQVPYSEWYNQEATRNAIVRKVHDIIGFDNAF